MLEKLIEYFIKMRNAPSESSYGSELEQYIISKGPQSAAEIDYWTQQFDRQQHRSWL